MSRPIKYRAWDKIHNRFIQISSLQIGPDGSVIGVWELCSGENVLYGMHQVILLQFTGLFDSTGKEIYEGDVLTIHGSYTQVIKWLDEASCNCCNTASGYFFSKEEAECETIVGNIFENPELNDD